EEGPVRNDRDVLETSAEVRDRCSIGGASGIEMPKGNAGRRVYGHQPFLVSSKDHPAGRRQDASSAGSCVHGPREVRSPPDLSGVDVNGEQFTTNRGAGDPAGPAAPDSPVRPVRPFALIKDAAVAVVREHQKLAQRRVERGRGSTSSSRMAWIDQRAAWGRPPALNLERSPRLVEAAIPRL